MQELLNLKYFTMKKTFLFALLLIAAVAVFTSCTSSRKSRGGCPGTEGIIH